MSEPEPEIDVPYELRSGVWANHVDVFGDVEEATLDFVRLDPRDVARGSRGHACDAFALCILSLKSKLERFI